MRDLRKKQFGRWTVLRYSHNNVSLRPIWLCRCSCGNERTVLSDALINGRSQSCGCLRRERTIQSNRMHGLSKAPVYNSWWNMLARCNNPNGIGRKVYYDRGITVCERWKTFTNFLEDMGLPPKEGMVLDRENNDGDYEPSNCRWVDRATSSRNRRSSRLISFHGETRCISEWAELSGINDGTLRSRLQRGWSIERALARTELI